MVSPEMIIHFYLLIPLVSELLPSCASRCQIRVTGVCRRLMYRTPTAIPPRTYLDD